MAYVKHEDLCSAFKGDTLLAIRAPTGTQLEVPIPESVSVCIIIPISEDVVYYLYKKNTMFMITFQTAPF
ncbi:unnamed protein product [Oncorhynchus mykiss]|uniref:E2F transcription factor CC-MB domain-containing protein n=1 Tax=Oncorhynchus mykiss TaxID=8022 RepID=A0A060YNV5_ONCMY|nr:unnamed protein product [Oncorhynchus mykiss]